MKWAFIALVALGLSGCTDVSTQALPPATPTLANPSFDQPGGGVPGWAQRGQEFGRARVVTDPVASPPQALELEVTGRRGSSGNNSFMLYQVLDPAPYRGRKVRFGAKVLTRGGAVNMTLFTPEKNANDFLQDLNTGRYVDRTGQMDVPANAAFLSFGIQIMGSQGAKAYLDDVFVTAEGAGATAPAAPGANAAAAPPPPSAAQDSAEVRIDASKPGATANANIFGMHLEWADSGNGIVDASGSLRRDVVQDLVNLRLPIFRFPGGIHADYYNWRASTQTGKGATAWNVFTNKNEPNLFGSAEFIQLLKATSADALVTANYGTGTAQDAGAWARYFQDAGRPAKFWEIGNEIYLADPQKDQPNGRKIAKPGDQYAADFPRFRDAIRAATPDAKVGLIGHIDSGAFPITPASRRDWTSQMLTAFRGQADFISVHNAYAPVIIDDRTNFDDPGARTRVYEALYAAPRQTVDDLTSMIGLLDKKTETRGLPIAITEWGPLFGYSNRANVNNWYVDQSRTMAAAIYVASMIDTLLGQPRVMLATYTNPIHRYYGSLITNTDRGLVLTPSYHVYSLYRTRFETRMLPASVSGPVFQSTTVGLIKPQRDVPRVLASASVSPDGRRLTAMLVSRDLERTLPIRLTIQGFSPARSDCRLLSASSPNAINGPGITSTTTGGKPIEPQSIPCTAAPTMTVSLPPSSVLSVVMEAR
jgi:alpha-N-arabinofuranosidase